MEQAVKICTKCGEAKSVDAFGKERLGRGGLRAQCRTCEKAYSAQYRAANADRLRVSKAAWKTANPEKYRASQAAYRAANPEKIKATCARYRAANLERVKAVVAKYRASNPEAARLSVHNRRARKREAGGRLSKDITTRLLKLQRGKCACGCRQPLGDDFHRDHILPLALGGSNTDDNIQLLRATCNLQKNAKHPVEFMQQRGFLL